MIPTGGSLFMVSSGKPRASGDDPIADGPADRLIR